MPGYSDIAERLALEVSLDFDLQWSAAPDFLQQLADHCLQARPSVIVECSSGTSSIVLAQCCRLNGRSRVYSLENGASFAASTREQLKLHGLEAYCTVIDAPLQPVTVCGETFQWYQLDGLVDGLNAGLTNGPTGDTGNSPAGTGIDLLVIDGPPGFIQPRSRFPAMPLLAPWLADSAVIMLDDAVRDDEQRVVEQWLRLFPEFSHHYLELERGCSVLYR
jgi:hypothetical protein